MGVILKRLMMMGATMLAGYAMKKVIGSLESRAQTARSQADEQLRTRNANDPKAFKRLKQDPATGVYYAED